MKKIHPFFLSLSSGLLLFAAWPVSPLTFLLFIAFVPLLWLEQQSTRGTRFFGWTYLCLLTWNVTTTWWVCNSTLPGGISAIMANSLLMCIPWIAFYQVKKRMGPGWGYTALVAFWLSFECIHLNWELSWPWLTLGNGFATHPNWVQWYSFTGVSGGSLWVLIVNLLIFLLLRKRFPQSQTSPHGSRPDTSHFRRYTLPLIVLSLLLIALPLFSYLLIPSNDDSLAEPGMGRVAAQDRDNIVIVQPNIDPYEKFAAGNQEAELQKLIRLSESRIDSNTALVVWPETAIPEPIDEERMKSDSFMTPVWDFLRRHPALDLLTGIEGYRVFDAEHRTPYSFRIPGSDAYEDSYNSAALLDSADFRIYHKSKLVPGVETLPSFLKFMTPLFEKFGGTTGGYARQAERTTLSTHNQSYHIAPSVCYESIYGEFMSGYIRGGADLLVIITNDGWWGKTAGYRQHENYARLRAIETRRWIARSANTGISCFIDPAGKVIDPQPWDTTAVIKRRVPRTTALTFYVRHGDLLYRLAIGLAILLILWWLFLLIISKKPRHG